MHSAGEAILALAAADERLGRQLHPLLPCIAAEAVWGVREEMARLMAQELGAGEDWIEQQLQQFIDEAGKYLLP
jgi:hypothetical protein